MTDTGSKVRTSNTSSSSAKGADAGRSSRLPSSAAFSPENQNIRMHLARSTPVMGDANQNLRVVMGNQLTVSDGPNVRLYSPVMSETNQNLRLMIPGPSNVVDPNQNIRLVMQAQNYHDTNQQLLASRYANYAGRYAQASPPSIPVNGSMHPSVNYVTLNSISPKSMQGIPVNLYTNSYTQGVCQGQMWMHQDMRPCTYNYASPPIKGSPLGGDKVSLADRPQCYNGAQIIGGKHVVNIQSQPGWKLVQEGYPQPAKYTGPRFEGSDLFRPCVDPGEFRPSDFDPCIKQKYLHEDDTSRFLNVAIAGCLEIQKLISDKSIPAPPELLNFCNCIRNRLSNMHILIQKEMVLKDLVFAFLHTSSSWIYITSLLKLQSIYSPEAPALKPLQDKFRQWEEASISMLESIKLGLDYYLEEAKSYPELPNENLEIEVPVLDKSPVCTRFEPPPTWKTAAEYYVDTSEKSKSYQVNCVDGGGASSNVIHPGYQRRIPVYMVPFNSSLDKSDHFDKLTDQEPVGSQPTKDLHKPPDSIPTRIFVSSHVRHLDNLLSEPIKNGVDYPSDKEDDQGHEEPIKTESDRTEKYDSLEFNTTAPSLINEIGVPPEVSFQEESISRNSSLEDIKGDTSLGQEGLVDVPEETSICENLEDPAMLTQSCSSDYDTRVEAASSDPYQETEYEMRTQMKQKLLDIIGTIQSIDLQQLDYLSLSEEQVSNISIYLMVPLMKLSCNIYEDCYSSLVEVLLEASQIFSNARSKSPNDNGFNKVAEEIETLLTKLVRDELSLSI